MSTWSQMHARAVADEVASGALLNCLIKEFALPLALLDESWREGALELPHALYRGLQPHRAEPLLVRMPDGTRFAVLADRRDPLGSQRYLLGVFGQRPGRPWRLLETSALARSLVDSCAALTGSRNLELLAQIQASRELQALIVAHHAEAPGWPLANYLASEQGLWFGHPAQPAPKARSWPASLPPGPLSPELGASFPLHLFQVPRTELTIACNDLPPEEALDALADQSAAEPGQAIISLHPVQAALFREDPRVQRLAAEGRVRDLGPSGYQVSPTASVRTLYAPGRAFFLKASLSVRITNCVRKNAWYELESALVIDRLLRRLAADHPRSTGDLRAVSEPAAVSWAPTDHAPEDQIWFREQTGTILRRNFCLEEDPRACLMAATVFARDLSLRPHVLSFIDRQLGRAATDDDLLGWFARYQQLLLRPVLSMFFHHGVVFEPHLQNTVLVHRAGQPLRLLLRDFEGVKLTAEQGMEAVAAEPLHPRVRASLQYPRPQGWNRIAYCAFVNNLSEAVLALTHGRSGLAPEMWQIVRRQLRDLRGELSAPAPELDRLLAGGTIPCKANLRVRLAAAADRHAGYVQLRAPWEPAPR